MMVRTSNGGFIALISAIIISAILLIITFTLSFSGFFGRFNTLNNEFKERSVALAEACGDTALLKIAKGDTITTPLTVPIGSDTCIVFSVQNNIPAAGQVTIKTQAIVQHIVTNIKIVANMSDASVVSWEEIPTIP